MIFDYGEVAKILLCALIVQIVFDNSLIKIKRGKLIIRDYVVEQDMSNMAYIDCFNYFFYCCCPLFP